jgi:uncharacterized SAM-binding protein YcdF (DUF218 family)
MDSPFIFRIASLILTPGNFLVLLLCAGCILLFTRWRNGGRTLVALAGLACLANAILPLGPWLARPLEAQYLQPALPARITGILVLSGGENDSRLLAALTLLRRHPESRVIFSGGIPPLSGYKQPESSVAQAKLSLMGVPPSRITWESKARNTWENFVFSRQIAAPKPDDAWILVTSGIHMPRAMEIANRLCWRVLPWPSERLSFNDGAFRPGFDFSQRLRTLESVVHEWLGLIAYRSIILSETQRCRGS